MSLVPSGHSASSLLHTHLDGRRATKYVYNKDFRQEDDGESESRWRIWSLNVDTGPEREGNASYTHSHRHCSSY